MLHIFKFVYIEITNVCNLNCSFCKTSVRTPQFITLLKFQLILSQIKPFTKCIYLHVKGEPLLHPEIDEILDICFKNGFQVNLTTNGTLINERKEKLFNQPAIRQINFSLHDFENNNSKDYIKDILFFSKEAIERTKIIVSLDYGI